MHTLVEIQAEIVQQKWSQRAKVYNYNGLEMSTLWTHFERKIGSDGDLGAEVKVTVGVTDGQHCVARGQGLGPHTTAVVRTWSQPLWIRKRQRQRGQQNWDELIFSTTFMADHSSHIPSILMHFQKKKKKKPNEGIFREWMKCEWSVVMTTFIGPGLTSGILASIVKYDNFLLNGKIVTLFYYTAWEND